MPAPVARVEVVRDTYFGTTVEDPYRWLEDWQGEEAQAWLEAQAEHAREVLENLPERDALLQRISELGNSGPLLYSLQPRAGRVFYLRRDPGENLAKLVVRLTPDAPEKVLFDANGVEGEMHTAIDWYAASWDGGRVAYGISQGGSENSTLHVIDVDSGAPVGVEITRTLYGLLTWMEDNESFVYNRSPELPVGDTGRYCNSRVYLHRPGRDPEEDPAIFGVGVKSDLPLEDVDIPTVEVRPGGEWAVARVMHGDMNEISLYVAPVRDLADPANCAWKQIAGVDDAITGFDVDGDRIYMLTHKDAPRYKVIAASLSEPDLSRADVVVPESDVVVEALSVVGDYLLVTDLAAGIGRMRRVRLGSSAIEPVALPFDGTVMEWAADPRSNEVLFQMSSWTVSPRLFRYNLKSGAIEDTGYNPPSPVDFSEIEAHEVMAPGKDGTLIPLSIVHKRGLELDGSNPALLTGYGSYGISLRPGFAPTMLAWYERGGVFAVAHIRGGGEYGHAWHAAGQKLTKQNTIDDFIACAEYLIEQGYTRPDRLAGEGTSAGGIPSGNALVQRPDLWAVMVIRVALTNALRFELTENGPPNVLEFGSTSTEEGFRGLQIMDSYVKVRDGTPYPAVLLTTGANDPRVVVWMAAKMAARLQAATSSGKPVLLRVEFQGGHGMGSTKRQYEEELADKLAFLLHEFGEG